MRRLIIGTILAISILCCTQKQSADLKKKELLSIDMEKAIDKHTTSKHIFSEFIDSIKYIPLETNSNCYISDIQKIIFHENHLYIWDYNGILKFDSNGKFVCKIGNTGHGPGEYIQNRGIIICSDTLFINSGNRILAYHTNTGDHLMTFPFKSSMFFEKIGGSFVALNEHNGYIEFFDQKGHIMDSINYERFEGEIKKGGFVYPFYDIFFRTHPSLKVSTSHNDTIFEITNSHTLTPRYVVNMGKYKLPNDERFEYVGDFNKFDKLTANYIRPIPFETSRYLIFQLGKWGMACNFSTLGFNDKKADLIGLGVFDKTNRQFYLLNEDMKDCPFFYPHFSDGQNCLITYVNAVDAIDFLNKNKNEPIECNAFTTATKNLKVDNNPIVIIAKLKE
jgi:hypothetical protein